MATPPQGAGAFDRDRLEDGIVEYCATPM